MSHALSDNEEDRRSLSPREDSDDDNKQHNSDNEDTEARRIDPSTSTKKIVRRVLPKLDPVRLKGPKGVATIENYFEGFKYHGKGHEKSDLNRIMKRLEHWAHRLFPKYQFDDFLEKVETLGSKKELQTYLTKYRRDMLTDDMIIEENDDNAEEGDKSPEPVDEFDLLIAEQIEKTKQATQSKDNSIIDDDDEVKKRMEANRKMALERKMAKMREKERQLAQTMSQPVDDFDLLISGDHEETSAMNDSKKSDKNEESEEEIKKRIERNRQLALERRVARMKQKEVEKDKENEAELSQNDGVTSQEDDCEEILGDHEKIIGDEDGIVEGKVQEDGMEVENNSIDREENVARNDESSVCASEVVPGDGNKGNTSKRLLTNEELDREIGAAVEMFMKKKR